MFLLRGKRLFERNKDAPFRTVKECYILVMINEKKRSTYLLFFSSFTCFVNSQQPWSLMKRNILVYLQINERGQIPRRRPNICFVSVWGKCLFFYNTCENVQNRIGCEPSKLQKLVFEPFVYIIYNKIYSNQTRMAGKCI